MMRTLRSLLLLLLICIGGTAFAQNASGIEGRVIDEEGEDLTGWPVKVFQGGRDVMTVYTDDEGKYLAKPLSPNTYEIRIIGRTGSTRSVQGINLGASTTLTTNINFGEATTSNTLKEAVIRVQRDRPVLKPNGNVVLSAEQIENAPVTGLGDLLSTQPNIQQGRAGGALNSGGGRTDGQTYIVDGIVLAPGDTRFTNQPLGSVAQIQALTGGVPSKYGDVSGAVIAITTKGSTDRIRGFVSAEHSVEGYNNNKLDWNFSGPLLKRRVRNDSGEVVLTEPYKDSLGVDIAGTGGKDSMVPAVGFVLNGQAVYNQDANPVYGGTTVVREDVLDQLRQNPLLPVANSSGASFLANASEYIREDQLEQVKRQPNNSLLSGRLNGKLDYSPNNNIDLYANGFFGYNRSRAGSRTSFLFAPENQAVGTNITGRGSARLTQRFSNDTAKHGFGLQNAFYTVQLDFIRDYSQSEDERHGKNTFDYGYLGKFEENYRPFYATSVDPVTQRVGTRLIGYGRTGVTFTPSDKNPTAARYTEEFYRLAGYTPTSLQQIQNGRGLINGSGPGSVYSLFSNVGAIQGSWSKSRNDQFAISVDASFDYVQQNRVRHAVEFGLYYQQRSERDYVIGGASLWGLMRQLTQSVVGPSELDDSAGIYIVGGRTYTSADILNNVVLFGPTDTIKYNRIFNEANQGSFDKTLRERYGYSNQDYINIDALDPSQFSVDMFSADELLNNGQNLVRYSGYDYMGNLQNGQINFNDFWTKKDSRGYATRPIGAFRPNYIAGYLSDYITYKDFKMTLGVRLERYDANTKVLKDPYSLYNTRKATSDNAFRNTLNNGAHPGNIGSDYVVYVNDALAINPTIVGYRDGDSWYDYSGKLIEDPTVLKNYSGGRDPQPYVVRDFDTGSGLSRITSDNYNPDNAFTDYKPAVNVSPRINFTFPIVTEFVGGRIIEKAYFFAHYDLLVQRPIAGAFATQVDYLAIQQRGQVTIGNPNLRPQRTFDYELGFSNQLTQNSGITITAFYKERKDLIQYRPYLYAYPNTYYTYGNRDFSTTKGLTLSYDLQRTGPVSATLSYTLSFAEGTGSNAGSSSVLLQNFISAGLPNLRYVTPLSYDSRHNVVLNLDYRYISSDGVKNKGPQVFGAYPFENAGFNIIGRFRSGEPYTRYQEAQTVLSGVNVSRTINGGINSSRLPWHYWLDARVDKSFVLKVGRNKNMSFYEKRQKGGLSMNAYVRVENVLNVRDVLGVYGYTGSSTDDGYLTSVSGINTINNQQNPSTFVNLYQILANNPNNFNLPRRINLGLQVYF